MSEDLYMKKALELAFEAAKDDEVPVGCIITDPKGIIIGCGRNRRNSTHDATAHAEMEAIRQACEHLGDWRLNGCTMYVTLEPCPMCTGAIINSRLPRLFYGAREDNYGSCGSVIDLFCENYGHRPAVYSGVLQEECSDVLRLFFEKIRCEK